MSDYLMTDISHADIQSDADRHLELTQPKNDPTALQQAFLWAQKHLPEESEGELYCYSTNSLTPDRRDFSKRRGAWSDHFVSTRVELVSSLIKLTDQPNVDVYVCLSTFDRAERKAQFVARRKTIINDFDSALPQQPISQTIIQIRPPMKYSPWLISLGRRSLRISQEAGRKHWNTH